MANFISGIISLTIGVVVLANVFIVTVKDTNTANGSTCFYPNGTTYICGWEASEIALWGLLSLIGIAGILYGVMSVFGMA